MRLSPGKKILFYGILCCILLLSVEFLFWGAYRLKYGDLSSARSEKKQIIAEYDRRISRSSYYPGGNKNQKNWNVIHPYLGFVTEGLDPSRECPEEGYCDQRARTYDDRPFVKSTKDNLIVAVIGGSFAAGVSYGGGRGYFEHRLRKIPQFTNREIIVYHLAPGGYKEPQQLMLINYYLTLGAEFDMIINVDGFNEIALPAVENLSKGVHPVFPRSWYYYVDSALNPELLALYGKRENYRLDQFRWAHLFSKPVLNFLPSANFLWNLLNNHLQHKIKMADVALVAYRENKERKLDYATTGPDYHFDSREDYYRDMAGIWARSSLQLFKLCQGLGIQYFHFLQPNQYVEGSKPMSGAEKKIALSTLSETGKAAAEGYPYLREKGNWLADQGVPFYDLTMIFSGNSDILYSDNCCHLNRAGYQLIDAEIAKRIGKNISSREALSPVRSR